MRYQVPQFIEIEDKIFGPFTFKQFTYLIGGGGLSAAIWFTIPSSFLKFILIAPVVSISLAFAFYKVNNKPFLYIFVSAMQYFIGAKLYVWKKPLPKKIAAIKDDVSLKKITAPIPKLSEGKLRDVAWSLGVEDSIYSTPETQREAKKQEMMKTDVTAESSNTIESKQTENVADEPSIDIPSDKPVHE